MSINPEYNIGRHSLRHYSRVLFVCSAYPKNKQKTSWNKGNWICIGSWRWPFTDQRLQAEIFTFIFGYTINLHRHMLSSTSLDNYPLMSGKDIWHVQIIIFTKDIIGQKSHVRCIRWSYLQTGHQFVRVCPELMIKNEQKEDIKRQNPKRAL